MNRHRLNFDLLTPPDSSVLQLKLKALILDIIHNIEVVKELSEAQAHGTDCWAWKKQLRFYLRQDRRCYIQMVDAEFHYTYEYQVKPTFRPTVRSRQGVTLLQL